jgi:group I intron endonuclease
MKTGVYTITNLITKHIYVGCTVQSFSIRWGLHKRQLREGTHNNSYLQRAWDKYGEENFAFEILVECNEKIIYSEEHYWATLLNTHDRDFGYNLKPTHPDNLSLTSEEARLKIKQKATGRKWSEDYKQLFREQKLGKAQSQAQIINAAKGKYKAIIQLDLSGNFIKEWESSKTACEILHLSTSNLCCALNGTQKTCGGFIWKFKNTDHAK